MPQIHAKLYLKRIPERKLLSYHGLNTFDIINNCIVHEKLLHSNEMV